MKSMKNPERLDYLLKKYMAKKYSRAEANELFDLLRTVHKPEELEELFRERWAVEGQSRPVTDILWDEVLEARDQRWAGTLSGQKTTRIRRLQRWVAAASVLLLISVLWWILASGPGYKTFSTGYGETMDIVLEDGSRITLNANSEITWNKNWQKEELRVVQLQGEAYFDVAHVQRQKGSLVTGQEDSSSLMPFRVTTRDMVIDVLGTAFNVTSRKGETTVFLERGVVQLDLLEQIEVVETGDNTVEGLAKTPEVKTANTLKMIPGEIVSYSAQTKEIEKAYDLEMGDRTEWKDGSLVYHNITFGEMLENLEGIYGKKFEVSDRDLLDKNVSFGVPYEDWETVKDLMEAVLRIKLQAQGDGRIVIISHNQR